jgi:hypothetical protein
MNVREGMRRLALLVGVLGAIAGCFASYAVILRDALEARARHKAFELLATPDVVQQERKILRTGVSGIAGGGEVSQPVQGPDGKFYRFPDGTTTERAIAYFKRKGIGTPAAIKPPATLPTGSFDRNPPTSLPPDFFYTPPAPSSRTTAADKTLPSSGIVGVPRYVQLPDGSYLEWPQGVSADEFKAKALKAVLDKSGAPEEVKAQAWDALYKSSTIDQFKANFDKLLLPRETKALLWDMKFSSKSDDPYAAIAYTPESTVKKAGIKTIHWTSAEYGVEKIETEDGTTLYPTPAPPLWQYLVGAIVPLFGFIVPWGVVRLLTWVWVGFGEK